MYISYTQTHNCITQDPRQGFSVSGQRLRSGWARRCLDAGNPQEDIIGLPGYGFYSFFESDALLLECVFVLFLVV